MVNNLEVNVIVLIIPLIYTLLHEFHNCKGHQGLATMFNMLKQKFWWRGMRIDIKKPHQQLYYMFQKPSQYCTSPPIALRNSQIPFACIAIDTVGKLPTTTLGKNIL